MTDFTTNQSQKLQFQSGDMDLGYVISVDNITGRALVGFGNSGDLQHVTTFESGRVLDPDNRFIGSFSKDEKLKIRAVYGQGMYDYYLDDIPKSTHTTASGGGVYSYDRFHIQPTNCTISLHEFSLSGSCVPLGNDTGYIQVTGTPITLQFSGIDPTIEYRIYEINTPNEIGLSIVSPTTGEFPQNYSGLTPFDLVLSGASGEVITSVSPVPINVISNCGTQTLNYNVSGNPVENDMLVNFIGYQKEYAPNECQIYKVITYGNVATGEYRVSLEYISGTGEMWAEGLGTGVGTGYFTAGGIGVISGSKPVSHSNMSGYIEIATAAGVTGSCSGVGEGYANIYATGETVLNYDLQVVGLDGSNTATGMLMGSLTGQAGDGSGKYCWHTNITGTPTIALTHTGVIIPPPGTPYTGHVNTCVVTTGNRPAGNYTGEFIGECAFKEGDKLFQNTWSLETGFLYNTGSARDYSTEGWLYTDAPARFQNTGFLSDSDATLPAGYNAIYARVCYLNGFTEASMDQVRLKIETPYLEAPVDDYDIILSGSKPRTIYSNPPTLHSGGLLTEGYEDILTEGGIIILV
jgi:hypothetical protein